VGDRHLKFHEIRDNLEQLAEQPTSPSQDPIVKAIVAAYEALEWVHSLDEHLILDGKYSRASSLDPVNGPLVEGAIGARNASHHGLRRVIGIVHVARPIYAAIGARWVHQGTYADGESDLQIRWVRDLPMRIEEGAEEVSAIRSTRQLQNFNEHLAGREVRHTFNAIAAFFFHSIMGRSAPPEMFFGPAAHPPPIDPDSVQVSETEAP